MHILSYVGRTVWLSMISASCDFLDKVFGGQAAARPAVLGCLPAGR